MPESHDDYLTRMHAAGQITDAILPVARHVHGWLTPKLGVPAAVAMGPEYDELMTYYFYADRRELWACFTLTQTEWFYVDKDDDRKCWWADQPYGTPLPAELQGYIELMQLHYLPPVEVTPCPAWTPEPADTACPLCWPRYMELLGVPDPDCPTCRGTGRVPTC